MNYLKAMVFRSFLASLISLLLVSQSALVVASLIPILQCKTLMSAVKPTNSFSNKEALKELAKNSEYLNSPYEIADFIKFAIDNKIEMEDAIDMLMSTPYVKLMALPRFDLRKAYRKILLKPNRGIGNIQRGLKAHVTAFKKELIPFTEKRSYNKELEILGVKNQCRLGSCWAYASVGYLELLVKHFRDQARTTPRLKHFKDLNDDQLQMAVEHYYALYIINEVKKTVKNGRIRDNEELFQQGGSFKNFMAFATTYGYGVPQKQWAPFKSYKKAMFKDKFLDALQALAKNHYDTIEKIKRNTEPVDRKREMIESEIKKAFAEIESTVESYTDNLEVKISVKGKEITPAEFFQDFVGSIASELQIWKRSDFSYKGSRSNSYVRIIDDNLRETSHSFPYRTNHLDKKDFNQMLKDEIDSGKPLYIAVAIPTNTYKDPVTNEVFTIINGKNGLTTMRGIENADPKIRGGHALVVTAYETDALGRLVTLKIQNSWGAEHGDNGFLHMDVSYAWKYMRHMVTAK